MNHKFKTYRFFVNTLLILIINELEDVQVKELAVHKYFINLVQELYDRM